MLGAPGVSSKSPWAAARHARMAILALPFLTLPIFIITTMGPDMPNHLGQVGNRTSFHPNLLVEGELMTRAFAIGCPLILLMIRFRLPRDAAAWKRHNAIYVAYGLAGISYFLMYVRAGAGGGWGWLYYGLFLIVLSVSLVSIGRYGYDLPKY